MATKRRDDETDDDEAMKWQKYDLEIPNRQVRKSRCGRDVDYDECLVRLSISKSSWVMYVVADGWPNYLPFFFKPSVDGGTNHCPLGCARVE